MGAMQPRAVLDAPRRRLVTVAGEACVALALVVAVAAPGELQAGQTGTGAGPLSEEAARALASPVPYSEASIAKGQRLYHFHGCAECHGRDGRALIEVVADATDLTDPELWRNGAEEGSVYRSIRDGAGLGMPPYSAQVAEEAELWHLVNFVRSLWPMDRRPPLAADPP